MSQEISQNCITKLIDSGKPKISFFNRASLQDKISPNTTQIPNGPFHIKSRYFSQNNNARALSPTTSQQTNNQSDTSSNIQSNFLSQKNTYNPFSNSGHGFLSYNPNNESSTNSNSFPKPSLNSIAPPNRQFSSINLSTLPKQNNNFARPSLNPISQPFPNLRQNSSRQTASRFQLDYVQNNQKLQTINSPSIGVNNSPNIESGNFNFGQKLNNSFNVHNSSIKSPPMSNTRSLAQGLFKDQSFNQGIQQQSKNSTDYFQFHQQNSLRNQQPNPTFYQQNQPANNLTIGNNRPFTHANAQQNSNNCPQKYIFEQSIQIKGQFQKIITHVLTPLFQTQIQIKKEQAQQRRKLQIQQALKQQRRRTQFRPFYFNDDNEEDSFFNYSKKNSKQDKDRIIVVKVLPTQDKKKLLRQRRNDQKMLQGFAQQCQGYHPIMKKSPTDNTKESSIFQPTSNRDTIFVSQFPEIWKLQYNADLRWLEQPDIIRKKINKAFVEVSKKARDKEIEEAILLDLKIKGQKFRENSTTKFHDIDYKRYKPNIIMRYLFGKKQMQLKQYIATCTIFEKKINLPSYYKYSPTVFKGFSVKDLKIKNEHGSVTWPGQTNVQNVCFSRGLKICKGQIICDIVQLQKISIVQFFGLTAQAEGKSFEQIKKNLEKNQSGTEILSIDPCKLKHDFSKQKRIKV